MNTQESEIRPTGSQEKHSESALDVASARSANLIRPKSEKEIDDQFQKIKERLRQEKNDGSRSKLKQMVQSLNFDHLQTFGDQEPTQQQTGIFQTDQKLVINPSKDFEEISLCNDKDQGARSTYDRKSQEQVAETVIEKNGEQMNPVFNQGYAQSMMEKFSNLQEIEDQVTQRALDLSQEMVHHSQIIEQATQNAAASHAFKHSIREPNQSIPDNSFYSNLKPTIQNSEEAEEDEDNILSQSSQKRKRNPTGDFDADNDIDKPVQMMSSRSSKKELEVLHDSSRKSIMVDAHSESKAELKQMRILNQSEISKLSEPQKQEYIAWLKEEIHNEVKRELKFKSLQDDLGLLHKNFALEQELHKSEQENRKLQLWILEDKQDQLTKQVEESTLENKKVTQSIDDTKLNIENIREQLLNKQQEIEQVKEQMLEYKEKFSELTQQHETEEKESEQLRNELNVENGYLNEENELKDVKNSLVEEKSSLFAQIQSKLVKAQQRSAEKDQELLVHQNEKIQIESDIEEANMIIEKLGEEKDMYETQQSFLQKQNAIFLKEIDAKQQKCKFDQEFIMYGQKNNQKLNEEINQVETQIQTLKSEFAKTERETKMIRLQIMHTNNQIESQTRIIYVLDGKVVDYGQFQPKPSQSMDQQPTEQQPENQQSLTMRYEAKRPSNTASKKQDMNKSSLNQGEQPKKEQGAHLKSKSIQDYNQQLQRNDKHQSYIDTSNPKDICTWRESISFTEDSNKPIMVNSSCANTNRPMTQDALKKFLDHKHQGLRHPKLNDQNALLQKLMTLDSQPSTEQLDTMRTHDELYKAIKDGAPIELKPRDLDESQSNVGKGGRRGSTIVSQDYNHDGFMKIQQNAFNQEQLDYKNNMPNIDKFDDRNKAANYNIYDLPRKQDNKENCANLAVNNGSASQQPQQERNKTNLNASQAATEKYQKFFTAQSVFGKNEKHSLPQKTDRNLKEQQMTKQKRYFDSMRNKSTDAKSDIPSTRHYFMKEPLMVKQDQNEQNRSFNLSQISRIGSDIAKPEKTTYQDADKLKFNSQNNEYKHVDISQNNSYMSSQFNGNKLRSDRSKEREAILKQTQELIKKSQDRLRWHQTENKNLNAVYALDKLKPNQQNATEADVTNQSSVYTNSKQDIARNKNFEFIQCRIQDTKLNEASKRFDNKEIQFNDYRNLRAVNSGSIKTPQNQNQHRQLEHKKETRQIMNPMNDSQSQSALSQMLKQNAASTPVNNQAFQTPLAIQNDQVKYTQSQDNWLLKQKYQTGDVAAKDVKIKAFKDNSFENYRAQPFNRQYQSDVLSQGSTDNILHKKKQFDTNLQGRPSRSKDEVQNYAPTSKRATSQSSQFKSRTAMRVLGISQNDQPNVEVQRAIQTLDVNERIDVKNMALIPNNIHASNQVNTDSTPKEKGQLFLQTNQRNYPSNNNAIQNQSRNYLAQGTAPKVQNDQQSKLDVISNGLEKRRKSEYNKKQELKRNHSSFSALEVNSKSMNCQMENQKEYGILLQNSFNNSRVVQNEPTDNIRKSFDYKLGSNYQVRFESNENGKRQFDTRENQVTKSLEGRFDHASFLLKRNAQLRNIQKCEPQSTITLPKQNDLTEQPLFSNNDDCKSSKSYCPAASHQKLTISRHETQYEPKTALLKQDMKASLGKVPKNQSVRVSQSNIDFKNRNGPLLDQKNQIEQSCTSILKEEVRSEYNRPQYSTQNAKENIDKTQNKKVDGVNSNLNSFKNSKRSIMQEEQTVRYEPKHKFTNSNIHPEINGDKYPPNNILNQNAFKDKCTQQSVSEYSQRMAPNQNASLHPREDQSNHNQKVDMMTLQQSTQQTKRTASRSPDNILGFKSKFAQRQINDNQASSRNDLNIQILDQQQTIDSRAYEQDLYKNYKRQVKSDQKLHDIKNRNDHQNNTSSKFSPYGPSFEKEQMNVHTIQQQSYNVGSIVNQKFQIETRSKNNEVTKKMDEKMMYRTYENNYSTFQDAKAQAVYQNNQPRTYDDGSLSKSINNLSNLNSHNKLEELRCKPAAQHQPYHRYSKDININSTQSSQAQIKNQFDLPFMSYDQSKQAKPAQIPAPIDHHLEANQQLTQLQTRSNSQNQKHLQTDQRNISHVKTTSRNMMETPEYNPNGTLVNSIQGMQQTANLDDIKETKILRSMSNKWEEPEMKYYSQESFQNFDKNDSFNQNQGQKEYNLFKPLESQTVTSSQLQTGNLGSTIGQVLTPYLNQNPMSSHRSTEKSNIDMKYITSVDNAHWSNQHLSSMNYNMTGMNTYKELTFLKKNVDANDQAVNIMKVNPNETLNSLENTKGRIAENLNRQDASKDERKPRNWGNFKSSFAQREMSRGSRERSSSNPSSVNQVNAQIASNKAHLMEMPKQYVQDQNSSIVYNDYDQVNVHTFNRRQTDGRNMTPCQSSNVPMSVPMTHQSSGQIEIVDVNNYNYASQEVATPYNQNVKQEVAKLECNSHVSSTQDIQKADLKIKASKLSQFLKPNLAQNKIEMSSLANITEQVITGNIKDYKQQQSQQILKMQQELQQMHKEANHGQRIEPNTAVPVGYKRKGSQDYTLDLSMEDKLSEYMHGNKKAGINTPFVIHQQVATHASRKETLSEHQTHQTYSNTVGTQKIPAESVAIKRGIDEGQIKHVDIDSDIQSSMYIQGSGMNSHARVMRMLPEAGHTMETPKVEDCKERDYLNLQDTVNLSLEEQADIITQLRSSKSQRGRLGH